MWRYHLESGLYAFCYSAYFNQNIRRGVCLVISGLLEGTREAYINQVGFYDIIGVVSVFVLTIRVGLYGLVLSSRMLVVGVCYLGCVFRLWPGRGFSSGVAGMEATAFKLGFFGESIRSGLQLRFYWIFFWSERDL